MERREEDRQSNIIAKKVSERERRDAGGGVGGGVGG